MTRSARRIAPLLPWAVPCVVVSVLVAIDPTRKSVLAVYHLSVERFAAREPMHEPGILGFLYLPAFAMLFAPFHALGPVAGGILWRVLAWSLLAAGAWRLLACLTSEPRRGRAFFWSGLLLVVGGVGALRNGQSNLWVGALMVHAALDLRALRLRRAAALLVLSAAMKPIGVVPLLLFGALERRLIPWLAAGVVVLLGVPFLFAEPGYVWEQYVGFVVKLKRASVPPDPYTEAFGGLQLLGLHVPHALRTGVRALVALLTLWAVLRIRRRRGAEHAALAALGLAAAYLMAFNPRTEANAYIILAGVMAPYAAAAWVERRRAEALWLTAGCVLRGSDELRGSVHGATRRWLKPLIALVFGAWIARAGLRAPAAEAAPRRTTEEVR